MAVSDVANTDLSWNDFKRARNVSLAEAREFCSSRGLGRRDIDIYHLLASKNLFADIRADLAVSCIAQAVKEGKGDINNPDYELDKLKYSDIIAGYKKNPEALKALGANMPAVVAIAINHDKTLRSNPDFKFMVEAMATNADTYADSMRQIADKGFKAGYGVEKMMYKFKRHLKRIEKLKAVHQELDSFRAEAIKRIGSISSDELNINAQSVVDAALAKAHGEIDNPFRPAKRISIFKVFTMGWKKRAAKNAEIKKQEQQCRKANKVVAELAAKCKDSKVLSEYKTYADIKRYLNSAKTADDYAQLHSKLFALYKSACQTLIKQTEQAKTAHKTSGVYAAENTTGIDVIAAKAKVRAQNANIGVRELYEKSGLIAETKPAQALHQEPEVKPMPQEEKPEPQKEVKSVRKHYPLPADLKSKNPHIQKAIDLVRSEKYESYEAMQADKENFTKLPKYAKDTAKVLFASSHNGTEWDTEKKKAAYAKSVVRQAEACVKAGLNKLSFYKDLSREKRPAHKNIKKLTPKPAVAKIISNAAVRSA